MVVYVDPSVIPITIVFAKLGGETCSCTRSLLYSCCWAAQVHKRDPWVLPHAGGDCRMLIGVYREKCLCFVFIVHEQRCFPRCQGWLKTALCIYPAWLRSFLCCFVGYVVGASSYSWQLQALEQCSKNELFLVVFSRRRSLGLITNACARMGRAVSVRLMACSTVLCPEALCWSSRQFRSNSRPCALAMSRRGDIYETCSNEVQ